MLTTESAAQSVRGAIEAWGLGKDHGLILWRKIEDPIQAVERSRNILHKVYLGNLGDSVLERVDDKESDAELLAAAEWTTKDLETKLLSGVYFERTPGNLFERGTAEIKARAAAEFVRRMRRVLSGEET